jgi:hypothetical protein
MLSSGTHTVEIVAKTGQGSSTAKKSWTFTVSGGRATQENSVISLEARSAPGGCMAFLALAEPGKTSRALPLLLLTEGRIKVSEGNQKQQDQQGQGGGPLGGVTEQVGQVAQGAQETAGQAVDQATQAAEGLAPGTELLSETTNEAGQTIQRTVDETGNVVENTLDESGNVLDESPLGSITDLPAEEEYTTEEGQTVRTVKDESGTLISLQLGEDGSLLNLQIPPPTETGSQPASPGADPKQCAGLLWGFTGEGQGPAAERTCPAREPRRAGPR